MRILRWVRKPKRQRIFIWVGSYESFMGEYYLPFDNRREPPSNRRHREPYSKREEGRARREEKLARIGQREFDYKMNVQPETGTGDFE